MHRVFLASAMGVLLASSPALAADDNNGPAAIVAPAMAAAASALAPAADLRVPVPAMPKAARVAGRPFALPALYAGAAALQAYDTYSTLAVLKLGGREVNPVMKGVTKSPVAFVALKAGMATMSIMAAERMWKRNNRAGAILTMVASNAFMAYVASNNARVLARMKH